MPAESERINTKHEEGYNNITSSSESNPNGNDISGGHEKEGEGPTGSRNTTIFDNELHY